MDEYPEVPEALLELVRSLADKSSSDEEGKDDKLKGSRFGKTASEQAKATRLIRGRISNNPPRPPNGYLCPYSGVIMEDPVLANTGVTYERKSLEEILHRNDGICVETGMRIVKKECLKNRTIKKLISRWCKDHNYPQHQTNLDSSPLRDHHMKYYSDPFNSNPFLDKHHHEYSSYRQHLETETGDQGEFVQTLKGIPYLRVLSNISVTESFWKKLRGETRENKGDWLDNDHINAWAGLLRESRASGANWTIMPADFLSLVSFNVDVLSYLDGSRLDYPAWSTIDTVYIPVNIADSHWFLGKLDLQGWTLTTYDSLQGFTGNVDDLLDVFGRRLPRYLSNIGYFQQLGQQHVKVSLTRKPAENVPQQMGHGDCGILVCLFMTKLIRGESLDLETSARNAAKKFRRLMEKELSKTLVIR